MNDERLNKIEKKVDRLIALMEGIHGADGLVSQVYSNKKDIGELRKLLYKTAGALTVIVPVFTLTLKTLI